MVFNWPMMMLVSTRTTYTSIFWNTFKKVYFLVRNPRQPSDGRPLAGHRKTKKLKSRSEFTTQIFFSYRIVFEKGFFFDRRGGHIHSSILKIRLRFKGSPNTGWRSAFEKKRLSYKTVYTCVKNRAMNMAIPTIKK